MTMFSRQLLAFQAVAQELHFGRAAQRLHMTQPPLSQQVRLFERFGPKVVLTAAGQELLKEGRYLLRAASDLESRVRRVASGWETEIALGMDSMLSAAGLPAGLKPAS